MPALKYRRRHRSRIHSIDAGGTSCLNDEAFATLHEGITMSNALAKEIYTGHTHIIGGRDGSGRSSDGALDVKLSMPGSNGPGTNPEQLLGVGWAACFLSAMGIAAAKFKLPMPKDANMDVDITLGTVADGNYGLAAKLSVSLPGLSDEVKKQLVEAAHQTCPYSRATRGNIDVEIEIR
jgi:osmotically inducible protein OsmC